MTVESWWDHDPDTTGAYYITLQIDGIKPGTVGWKGALDRIVKEMQSAMRAVEKAASEHKSGDIE